MRGEGKEETGGKRGGRRREGKGSLSGNVPRRLSALNPPLIKWLP